MCECNCRPEKKTMTANVMHTRDGLKIMVNDEESDSLAVIEITRKWSRFMARVGLRGNYDVKSRPLRWVSTMVEAPDVSEDELADRKRRARVKGHIK